MMDDPSSVILATRGSRLARIQTDAVATALASAWPCMRIATTAIRTSGDVDRQTPLASSGAQGWFSRELEHALLDGRADLAVHSLKDLPTRMPEGLRLLGCLQRGDVRDLLIFRPDDDGANGRALAPGDLVATGSPRRRAEIARRFPGAAFAPIRGNVATRLRKLREDPGLRATVLAAAGLQRLGLLVGKDLVDEEGRAYPYLPFGPPDYLPAPGQALIGVEGRDLPRFRRMVDAVTDVSSMRCAAAERAFMSALGAGCQVAAGGWASVDASTGMVGLVARVLRADGGDVVEAVVRGDDPEAVGAEAGRRILDAGGRRILEEVR